MQHCDLWKPSTGHPSFLTQAQAVRPSRQGAVLSLALTSTTILYCRARWQ